jgi:hypothetical protein
MNIRKRPVQATIFAALLAGSGLFMIWLGTMASAYYVPGACLLLLALLLWKGRALRLFERLLTQSGDRAAAPARASRALPRRCICPSSTFPAPCC